MKHRIRNSPPKELRMLENILISTTKKPKLKQETTRVGETRQRLRHLPCMHQTLVRPLTTHTVLQAPPAVIPKHRARNFAEQRARYSPKTQQRLANPLMGMP